MESLKHIVYFLCGHSIVITILLGYIIYILKQYNKKAFKHNYNDILKRESRLQKILEIYLEKLLCDRILICQFHNGESNLKHMKFIKFSVTNEIDRSGISSIQEYYKDILISKFAKMCELMDNEGEIVHNKLDIEKYSEGFKNIINNLDLKSSIILPIKFHEETIGFISIQYTQSENFGEQDKEKVLRYSYELLGSITESINRNIK